MAAIKASPQSMVFPSNAVRCETQSGVSLSSNEQDLENVIDFHQQKAVSDDVGRKVGIIAVERIEKAITCGATPKSVKQRNLGDPFRLSPIG